MLDLFSGTGGASAPMRRRGWDVVRVDNGLTFTPDTINADLTSWSWSGPTPDLLWASPPCTEFARESMPWSRTGKAPDLALLLSTIRIISETRPRWWVIENVRGAQPYLGRAPRRYGPVYLWGWFPDFRVDIKPWKERLSSTAKAERGRIPYPLGEALAIACERSLRTRPLVAADARHPLRGGPAHGDSHVPTRTHELEVDGLVGGVVHRDGDYSASRAEKRCSVETGE